MPERLTSTNISPGNDTLSSMVRWCKINIGGKVLHTITGGGRSLSDTFTGFLQTIGIKLDIDEESGNEIHAFCEHDSGVIILNHPNNNFADYIPFLAQIPEHILQQTTFFAVKQTVPMFKREFGSKYNFVEASFDSISEAKEGLQNLEAAITQVQEGKGYIFIIPGGTESEDSEIYNGFKALFQRIVSKLTDDTALLAAKISYPHDVEYPQVYKRALKGKMNKKQEDLIAKIRAKNISTGFFKGEQGENMRAKYETLFEA